MRFRDVWASGSYITQHCMFNYFDDDVFHIILGTLIFVSMAFSDCIGQVGVLTGSAHLSCRVCPRVFRGQMLMLKLV